MTARDRESCIVFHQLKQNPDDAPSSIMSVIGALMKAKPEEASVDAEMVAALEAPVCEVEGCRLSIGGLMRYVLSAGDEAPRQALDEAVAPSCALLDIPHVIEENAGPYMHPDDPRTQT